MTRADYVCVSTERSDHFDGARFMNPGGATGPPLSKVPRLLLSRRTPWPARIDAPARRPPELDGAAAVVTFIGHATFLIQTARGNILTDPMYSQRAGPLNLLGPRRVRQPAVRFDPDCVAAVRQAAQISGYTAREIVSGASHDAAYVSRVAPSAMVFVPCRDGISHNEAEFSSKEQCAAGAQVLLQAVLDYDRQLAERGVAKSSP